MEILSPLSVSPNGRYFVDKQGHPVFWLGDTQWELFRCFTAESALPILRDRQRKGFNVILVMLTGVDHRHFNKDTPFTNIHGDLPWIDDDPLQPNDRYFQHIDTLIRMGEVTGQTFVVGIYHQWHRDIITEGNARAWARWVATRYRDVPNLIWSMYPRAEAAYIPVCRELAAGLQDGDQGTHLISVHPDPAVASSSFMHEEPWLAFNMIQTCITYERITEAVLADYYRIPIKPVVMAEGGYEGLEFGREQGAFEIRKQAYWTQLAGGYHVYGHNDAWTAPHNWQVWLDSPGSRDLQRFKALVTGIDHWWELVPDPRLVCPAAGSEDAHVAAARSADNQRIVGYISAPIRVSFALTESMKRRGSMMQVTNPATGESLLVKHIPAGGPVTFTTPYGWEDALVVLEACSASEKVMSEKVISEKVMSEKTVDIRVDASGPVRPFPHNWTYIGYDEINYTYTPEGKDLLAKFEAFQEQPYYIRAHHLLCTGNCHGVPKWGSTNVYLEDEDGNPRYDWTFVDLIFDTILGYSAKPFVELGFMPLHLADPVCYDTSQEKWMGQHYRTVGWACPPRDYQCWYELIFQLVTHCVERYGEDEVRQWYWELWNEPDIYGYYWRGTFEAFCTLYDYTAAAVKAACSDARVGGPAVTNPHPEREAHAFLDGFLDHCANGVNNATGQHGTPLDFITFHVKGGGYSADPLHRPQKPPSVQQILRDTIAGYEVIQRFPGYEKLECILSEIDPDGWAAGGAWDNVHLNFRNTEYYPSFVVAAFDKVSRFAHAHDWDLRLLTWAFLFVGERCFEGTRVFSTQGIDKAILNLFRMYALLGQQELPLSSSASKNPLLYSDPNGYGEGPDISGMATIDGSERIAVLIYNHHDDWEMNDDVRIQLTIDKVPMKADSVHLTHYRIDHTHSNAYAEWVRQGKPMYPSQEQWQAMKARAGLEKSEAPRILTPQDGSLHVEFELPVHGISLLVFDPVTA